MKKILYLIAAAVLALSSCTKGADIVGGYEYNIYTPGARYMICIADDLTAGDHIMVSWKPNRRCTFRYIGDGRFMVEKSENSKLKVGNTFSCGIIRSRTCLCRFANIDVFRRCGGSKPPPYA